MGSSSISPFWPPKFDPLSEIPTIISWDTDALLNQSPVTLSNFSLALSFNTVNYITLIIILLAFKTFCYLFIVSFYRDPFPLYLHLSVLLCILVLALPVHLLNFQHYEWGCKSSIKFQVCPRLVRHSRGLCGPCSQNWVHWNMRSPFPHLV